MTLKSTLAFALALSVLGLSSAAIAEDADLVSGAFYNLEAADDRGYSISGDAYMVRADDWTVVSVAVSGLAASTSYGAHVHAAACADGSGGGHYKLDPDGDAAPPNEIWPAFTTNPDGDGATSVTADFEAGADAVSVVIHDTDGTKIACADLEDADDDDSDSDSDSDSD